LQHLQTVYPLQGLQKSQLGNNELTLEEKQAHVKHWLDRGKPTLALAQWFNLSQLHKALLHKEVYEMTDSVRINAPLFVFRKKVCYQNHTTFMVDLT